MNEKENRKLRRMIEKVDTKLDQKMDKLKSMDMGMSLTRDMDDEESIDLQSRFIISRENGYQ